MTIVHDSKKLFNTITNPTLGNQPGVLLFSYHSTESPILFLALLLSACTNIHRHVTTVDMCHEDSASLVPDFESSFLGGHTIYWLKNSSSMTAKQQKWWATYLATYTGPNLLICFLSKDVLLSGHVIEHHEIPALVDKKSFIMLYSLLYEQALSTSQQQYIDRIFILHETVSLESACLLIRYLSVVGSHNQEFLQEWLPKLVVTDTSLFVLSQHFFAKDAAKFFSCWSAVHMSYAPAFWIAFWSEQLWRASLFVMLNKSGKPVEARKAAYRLPFSFIQRDYKKYTLNSLQEAHTQLYLLDNALKNGGGELAFELFYANFFHGVSDPV